MIVIQMHLISAQGSDRDQELGTMVLDNITSNEKIVRFKGKRCDYRARMYRKGDLKKHGSSYALVANAKPIRESQVIEHAREAEPVQNLVAKALTRMGYG